MELVRYEFFTALNVSITVIWVVTLSGLVDGYQGLVEC
jgi:hypothetical protein